MWNQFSKRLGRPVGWLLLALVVLMGCGDGPAGHYEESNDRWTKGPELGERRSYKCVAADDFGYPKIDIPARPLANEIFGTEYNQLTYWRHTGLELAGPELLIGVEGRWSSWFKGSFNGESRCRITYKDGVCPARRNSSGALDPGGEAAYTLVNHPDYPTPCWFTHGYGAYILFSGFNQMSLPANPNGENPPDLTLMRTPDLYETLHVFGDNRDSSGQEFYGDMYVPAPPNAVQASRVLGVERPGDRIWSKILDRYYEDNAGGYTIKFKMGARYPGDGPLATIIKLVSSTMLGTAEMIYKNVVGDVSFRKIIYALLTLFILVSAFGFITGFIKQSQTEVVIRIVKFALITQLISGGSWDFFFTHLLGPLIYGVDDLICIVANAAVPGSCYNGAGVHVFDSMLHAFTSGETNAKISSSLFYNQGAGIVYLVMLYAAIAAFLFTLAKVLVNFLIAYIPMAILVILMPVFLSFILFKFTKQFFDSWLREFLSVAIQSFLAMAALALFMAVIMDMLHRTVGYRVCWKCFWCPVLDFNWLKALLPFLTADLRVPLFGGSYYDPDGMKYWLIDIRTSPAARQVTEAMFLNDPQTYLDLYPGHMGYMWLEADALNPGLEFVFRNPTDLPYLDPNTEPEEIERRLRGGMLSFKVILGFLLTVLLMFVYSKQVTAVGQDIAGAFRGIHLGDFGTGGGPGSIFSALGGAFDKYIGGPASSGVKRGVSRAGAALGRGGARLAGTAAGKIPHGLLKTNVPAMLDQMDYARSHGNDAKFDSLKDDLTSKLTRDLARDNIGLKGDGLGHGAITSGTLHDRKGFDEEMRSILSKANSTGLFTRPLLSEDEKKMSAAELKAKTGADSQDMLKKMRMAERENVLKKVDATVDKHFGGKLKDKEAFHRDMESMLKDPEKFAKEQHKLDEARGLLEGEKEDALLSKGDDDSWMAKSSDDLAVGEQQGWWDAVPDSKPDESLGELPFSGASDEDLRDTFSSPAQPDEILQELPFSGASDEDLRGAFSSPAEAEPAPAAEPSAPPQSEPSSASGSRATDFTIEAEGPAGGGEASRSRASSSDPIRKDSNDSAVNRSIKQNKKDGKARSDARKKEKRLAAEEEIRRLEREIATTTDAAKKASLQHDLDRAKRDKPS